MTLLDERQITNKQLQSDLPDGKIKERGGGRLVRVLWKEMFTHHLRNLIKKKCAYPKEVRIVVGRVWWEALWDKNMHNRSSQFLGWWIYQRHRPDKFNHGAKGSLINGKMDEAAPPTYLPCLLQFRNIRCVYQFSCKLKKIPISIPNSSDHQGWSVREIAYIVTYAL